MGVGTPMFTQRFAIQLLPEQDGVIQLDIEYESYSDLTALSVSVPDFLRLDNADGFTATAPQTHGWDRITPYP